MATGTANRFGVLGPLVVEIEGADRAPSAPRQRALLGLFLLSPGEPVSAERILDRLWGEEPPSGGVKTVGFHLSKLRDALEPDRGKGTDGSFIRTTPAGYVLDVDRQEVDASRFEVLLQEARAVLQEDPGKAAALARDALGLWRGPALADFAYEEFAQDEIRRLEEARMRAVETRIEADLALGRHADLVGELERLIADHPLREGLRASLMLALYRSGRQADALRAFEDTRRTLGDELGIDPSRELRDLESKVLDQDDSLDLPIWATPTAAAPRTTETPNPYKGLRPFGENDAEDFHGRDVLVGRVVDAVGSSRFVALVGPSGAGKSSVAAAGVIPALRGRHVVARMVPGDRPLDELEIALLRAFPDAPASAAGVLRSDAGGLRRMLGLLDPDQPVLLVIDQFEELWTLAPSEERGATLERLMGAVGDDRTPLHVLVTLRSDFLGAPLLHPDLGPLLDAGTVLVTPMTADELEQAIVQPAGRVGVQVDPSLTAAVVTDVAENPGALPLLQYALTEAFDQRDTDALTRADYERVGGLRAALAQRADETFAELTHAEQETARQVFLRLVTPGEGTTDTRRRAPIRDLLHLGPEVDAILDAFGSARLLTFDRDPATDEPTADLAHEAMLTQWDRLRAWIDEARDELTLRRRLHDLAGEWETSGQDPGLLLTGGRLDRYAQFADTTSLTLTDTEHIYVRAGLDAETEAQRRARNRRYAVLATLSVIATIAVIAALFGFASSRRANQEADRADAAAAAADQQAKEATARAIAGDALKVLETDPALGLLLALEAADRDRGLDVLGALQQAVDAQGLLYEVSNTDNAALLTYQPELESDLWGPEGLLVSVGPNGALELRDFVTGAVVAADDITFSLGVATENTGFNPAEVTDDNGTLVSSDELPGVYAMDWRGQLTYAEVARTAPGVSNTGFAFEGVRLPQFEQALPNGVAVVDDPELGLFFAGGACQPPGEPNPVVCVGRRAGEWVANNQTLVAEGEIEILGVFPAGATVTSAAVSVERDAILVGSSRGLLRFPLDGTSPTRDFDIESTLALGRRTDLTDDVLVLSDADPVFQILGLPGGRVLAGGSHSQIVRVLSLDPVAASFVAAGPVRGLASNADGSVLAASTVDGRVTVADSAGTVLTTITAQPGPIESVVLDSSGSLLATTGVDGTVRVHRIADLGATTGTESVREDASATLSGEFVAVADPGTASVIVVDRRSGDLIARLAIPVRTVSFAIDGRHLLVGTQTGELIVLETEGWTEIKRIPLTDGPIVGLEAGSGTEALVSARGTPAMIGGVSLQYTLFDWDAELVRRQLAGIGYDGNGAESFDPSGNFFAVAGQSDGLVTFDVGSKQVSILELEVVPSGISLSTDGELLLGTDASGNITAYEMDTGVERYQGPAHKGGTVVAIDPAGRWFATGGLSDGRVQLWDLASGETLAELRGGGSGIRSLWFDPDGERIGFLDEFATVDFVTTNIDDLLAQAALLAPEGRTLTPTECRTYLRTDECPAAE